MATTLNYILALVMLLTAMATDASSDDGFREWKSASGKYTVRALLEDIRYSEVVLRREDGQHITVSREVLSETDLGHIRSVANRRRVFSEQATLQKSSDLNVIIDKLKGRTVVVIVDYSGTNRILHAIMKATSNKKDKQQPVFLLVHLHFDQDDLARWVSENARIESASHIRHLTSDWQSWRGFSRTESHGAKTNGAKTNVDSGKSVSSHVYLGFAPGVCVIDNQGKVVGHTHSFKVERNPFKTDAEQEPREEVVIRQAAELVQKALR